MNDEQKGDKMIITERAIYIYNTLRKAGMTYAGAIGTIGNLQGETSDFDPMSCETSYLNRFKLTDDEYTRRADNGEIIYNGKYFEKDSAGYGIVQWTWWERKRNLLNYAKSLGKSVGDLDVQLAFMIKEMQESYTATWKVVSTTNDYTKAVKICVTNYEKPANQSQAISTRCAYAKAWLNIIKDETITPDVSKENDTSVTSGFDRKRVIRLALDQVGYLEKRNNSQLDDKIANAGSANYTKYARDLDAFGNFYNGAKQGFAWCDIFVDWLFVKCFGVENALSLLCQKYKSSGAGCTYSMAYYRANGQFHVRNEKPQVGDQIFFGSGLNDSNHTGIVYRVSDNMVYTIEGNTSSASGVIPNGGAVCKKAYKRSYINIIGYGRPKYNDGFNGDSIAIDSTPSTDIPKKPKKDDDKQESIKETTDMPMLKKGDKGTNVKKAQQLLIAKGYSCGYFGADGDFGDSTVSAVKAFQKANNLEIDGIIGEATWAKLLADDSKEDEPVESKKDNVSAPTPAKTQFDRQILLDIAYAEVGYLEKKSEFQLDDREANAGQANFNKYARDLDAIQNYYYHDRKQGLNWCDIFCDWCFVTAYGVNDSFTVNCQPQYSYGAGCPQSMAYYKAQGRLDMKPQVGDQFFLSDGMGSTGHTGLVVGVSNTMIDTIEGNQAVRSGVDGVVKKKRLISEIAGFGHPMYNDGYGTDDYIGKKLKEEKPDEPEEAKVEFNPPVLKRGDKGASVKKLQHLLIDSGISCGSSGADADFGPGTLNAVKIAQAKAKLSTTGIADEATWAWLIKY